MQHLRHVDAGVQHIHGNGDLRQLFRIGELVNRALGVSHIVINDLGKAGKMRVFFIENREDFLRMGVIFCKDDRFAQLTAVVDGQTVGHQRVQYLSDGVFIENPFVQRRGCNALRQFSVFIFEGVLIGLLVLVGKLIVNDALFNKFQLRLYRQEIHQIPVLHRLR